MSVVVVLSPRLSVLFLKTSNELARPVMGAFFLVYICRYVGMSVAMSIVCQINYVGGITWIKHAHAQSQVWAVRTDL